MLYRVAKRYQTCLITAQTSCFSFLPVIIIKKITSFGGCFQLAPSSSEKQVMLLLRTNSFGQMSGLPFTSIKQNSNKLVNESGENDHFFSASLPFSRIEFNSDILENKSGEKSISLLPDLPITRNKYSLDLLVNKSGEKVYFFSSSLPFTGISRNKLLQTSVIIFVI